MNKPKTKAPADAHAGVHAQAYRRRDNIIRHSRKRKADDVLAEAYAEAQEAFSAYLDSKRRKHTPERDFVLKKVYECQGPVDIQTLHGMVCQEEGLVSLTTVYNNLSLLVDARLVRKLDLVGGKMAFFEKTLGMEPHGYLICDVCGMIRSLPQPDTQELKLPHGFRTSDITFHVHGTCQRCATAARRQTQQQQSSASAMQPKKTRQTTKNKTTK